MFIPWFNFIEKYNLINFFVSSICGAFIGLEREARDKGAGIRTHTLVSLGSCLFTTVSVESVLGMPNGDPTRIAAQIVSGIGFLGGGAILQDRDKVHGLTTAATIWISAAIGMSCGMDQVFSAIMVTALTLFFLFFFRRLSKSIKKPRITWLMTIHFQEEDPNLNTSSDWESQIENTLKSLGFKILELSEKNSDQIEVVIRGQGKLSDLMRQLKTFLPDKTEIDLKEF
jgi:putative Mg2+ transporter-C (MgtC) family protein